MKKFLLSLILTLVSFTPAFAQTFVSQTDSFNFDKNGAITSWTLTHSIPIPLDPSALGSVSFTGAGYQQGIVVPFQLGYLNNGYLVPCNPITMSAMVWTKGNGKNAGDEGFETGSTACPYFTGEYGTDGNSSKTYDSFSVIADYTVVIVVEHPRFHPPVDVPVPVLTGGTGAIFQVVKP